MQSLLSRLQLGLRPRFLLAVFLAVIPALGLILFNAAEGRRIAAEQSERSAIQWSGVIANYQRDLERQARTLVAVLARDPALFTADHAGCNKRFADLLFNAVNEPDNFFNFVAADLNGDIYCSARQGTAGNMHIRDRVYFHKVLETKSVYVDDYVFGKIIKAPVIPVAGPIFDAGGELRGVMLVTINLAWIAKKMAPRMPPDAVLRIYDSKGTVLVQAPSHEGAVGKRGSDFDKVRACGAGGVFTEIENDGTERLYACSLIPYGEHAFHVAIGVPRGQAYAEADRVLRRSLALFVLVTFVVMVGAWVFGSSLIVKDIQRLMAAAREMALGHLSTRVDTHRNDEIGQLAMAFNEMAAALDSSTKDALAREEALATAKQAAETASLTKSRFLAAASHDLRQPMQAIRLFTGALARTELSAEQKHISDYLSQSTQSLSDILSSLLDISKLDAGVIKPMPEVIPVEALIRKIDAEFSEMAAKKSLRFMLSFPFQNMALITDARLIMSLLGNLIGNAIKYTEQGGILVAIRRRGNQALIQVWDTGIGIDAQLLSTIYEEYFQIANPERDREKGLGLGLAVVKRVAKLLETDVICHSRLGRGSVFEFRLPLADTSATETPGRIENADIDSRLGNNLAGRRIVVVEDDLMVATAIQLSLESLGASVNRYGNAEAALADAAIEGADFYLSDFQLPGLNGIEFLEAVQKRSTKPIKALLLTGDMTSRRIGIVQSSPWPVLFKPIDFANLLSEIRRQDSKR